jgi:nucleoside-diphosphate-sugar epimerase
MPGEILAVRKVYDCHPAMRACVTGATGFVGRALVRRLLRSGLSVRALVDSSEHADNLRAMGIELASANLANRDSVEEVLNGTDILYHTADTNLVETQNVFEACIRRGVPHVVYLSSIAVYGLAQKGEHIDENTPYDPRFHERDPDTRSKIEADQYAAAIGYKTKLAVTILRPGTVYGPGRPLPVAPLGYRAARNTNVVTGRRKQHFPLTYVENLADAMAIVSAGRGLRKFIVIDDEDLRVGRYHKIRQEVERTPTLFLPGLPLLLAAIGFEIAMWVIPAGFGAGNKWRRIQLRLQDRRFDTRRIRDTGWTPQVSLKDAIRHTLNYPPAENVPAPA